MTFLSHPVVQEHLQELQKITKTRKELRSRMTEVWEKSLKTEDDEERRVLVKSSQDLEQQIDALTAKGDFYMIKIDKLNGVR